MSTQQNASSPPPAYDLKRTPQSGELEYSSTVDSESYLAIHTLADSSVTGHYHTTTHADATDIVHEMHLALLYLLSNPEEFQKALAAHPARGATTLAEWNAEYDSESLTEAESVNMFADNQFSSATPGTTPLPFVVFADDAEVVLPQAHTASQLFGVERLEGIELEAAAGIPAISQLFLRWLALMPGGDHLNIIDPPGLTVMRIAGGRYRVTAAHRAVWTWMNEFAPLTEYRRTASFSTNESTKNNDELVNHLQVGDLVSMTIVDVFETDNQGKLLSYCPTFDNRAVVKTHHTTETLRRGGSQLLSMLSRAKNSKTAAAIFRNARTMAQSVKQKVDEAVHGINSPEKGDGEGEKHNTDEDLSLKQVPSAVESSRAGPPGSTSYMADDDLERHEV